ncbi:hypothetical protein [Noviherbaspirillum suwonense]|uniref:Rod shape-determining protein MreD n=1 Tax=Noviherbaspirillum suwonense TaxID=1224511 RepID=A0ABY1QR47_9BURK|nr:hypothetical protein [Noviherbaspirillum suwonense]SMP76382.1 hypothetical protein SAMN06295970_12446 [Noviherbaspirillum suwonense]
MTGFGNQSVYIKQVLLLFIIAVALNYLWEVAQAPLYAGLEDWNSVWRHCFVAALGDGILVWLIFVVGWLTFRRFDWYVQPNGQALAVMLAAGLSIGIGIEWMAVNMLGRWAYTVDMPLLPGLDVGLVPVVQMLLLPPLIFRIAAWWLAKSV